MTTVLSLHELPALQKTLSEYGCKLHVHDACGGQAFSLECNGTPQAAVYPVLEAFFAKHGMQLGYFGEDKLDFAAK